MRTLRDRGLEGVRLVISDAYAGLKNAIAQINLRRRRPTMDGKQESWRVTVDAQGVVDVTQIA